MGGSPKGAVRHGDSQMVARLSQPGGRKAPTDAQCASHGHHGHHPRHGQPQKPPRSSPGTSQSRRRPTSTRTSTWPIYAKPCNSSRSAARSGEHKRMMIVLRTTPSSRNHSDRMIGLVDRKSGGGGNRTRVHDRTLKASTSVVWDWHSPCGCPQTGHRAD